MRSLRALVSASLVLALALGSAALLAPAALGDPPPPLKDDQKLIKGEGDGEGCALIITVTLYGGLPAVCSLVGSGPGVCIYDCGTPAPWIVEN